MNRLAELITENLEKLPVPADGAGHPAEPARLLNGRGGRAPGYGDVNIDCFPPLLYVTVYRSLPSEKLNEIKEVLNGIFPLKPVLLQDRSVRPAESVMLSGSVREEIIVNEAGLRFLVHPFRGQNSGFFPDMRAGRALVREICSAPGPVGFNMKVLNLFAYTCSFSVAALAAGAAEVVNVDKNARSLEIGRRNHQLNSDLLPGGYSRQVSFLSHDIFKSFGKLKRLGPYGLIIADPPPSQKGSFLMERDYPRLLRRLPEMLEPGGSIMLTLNTGSVDWSGFTDMLEKRLPRNFNLERIQPPSDYAPAGDGRGLKIIRACSTCCEENR